MLQMSEEEEWLDGSEIEQTGESGSDYMYIDDNGHKMQIAGYTEKELKVYCEKCGSVVDAERLL